MLHQCSRGVPASYDGHWLPAAEDIAALEAALPAALAADHPGDRGLARRARAAGAANMAASCAAGVGSSTAISFRATWAKATRPTIAGAARR